MHLFQRALLAKYQRSVCLRPSIGLGHRLRLQRAEMVFGKLYQFLVRQAAGRCDQNILGSVIAPVVAFHAIAIETADGLPGPQNWTPQRMALPKVTGENFVDQVLGVVDIHLELFENDALFLLDVALFEQRMAYQVGDDPESARQMLVENLDVVADQFLGSERVEPAANRIHGARDLLGRLVLGALKQHVLDEMRNTGFFERLLA